MSKFNQAPTDVGEGSLDGNNSAVLKQILFDELASLAKKVSGVMKGEKDPEISTCQREEGCGQWVQTLILPAKMVFPLAVLVSVKEERREEEMMRRWYSERRNDKPTIAWPLFLSLVRSTAEQITRNSDLWSFPVSDEIAIETSYKKGDYQIVSFPSGILQGSQIRKIRGDPSSFGWPNNAF